jgi:ATP-dependent DNA helicase RecQ
VQELERLAALDDAWDWSRVAVIARTWETLNSVRAACEIAGVPCRFAGARQKALAPHRWREVWNFIEALKARRGALQSATEVTALAASLRGSDPATPGHALVASLIDDAYADMGELPRPVEALLEDAFEFLADSGRKAGTGLTLTTAHAAKGLEFDHVVVLDGGWEPSAAAELRLYYVAMTRARRTLTLCRTGRNGFADELANHPAVLTRAAPLASALPDGLDRRYELLGLKEVDLGFAGRSRSDTVRETLAKLGAGDPLTVVAAAGRWLFKTTAGNIVGRSARAYAPPAGRIIGARVAAIGVWRREDGDNGWQDRAVVDCWEFVLPEVELEPKTGAAQVLSPAVQRA